MGFLLDASGSCPQETVKILNSDESLDLFRKRSTSLIQLSSGREKVRPKLDHRRSDRRRPVVQARREALSLLREASATSQNPSELNFLALALSAPEGASSAHCVTDRAKTASSRLHGFPCSDLQADFTEILKKIDGMVSLLDKEQEDDKTKKSYCGEEFRTTEDKSKSLDSKIKSLKAGLAEKKQAIASSARTSRRCKAASRPWTSPSPKRVKIGKPSTKSSRP